MELLKGILVVAGLSVLATPTLACDVLDIFKGEVELATVRNRLPGSPDYETYLVRNAARGTDGVLYNSIRGEIVPSKVGFEVKNVAARNVGLAGEGTLDDVSGDASCKGAAVTYKAGKSGVTFLNGGRPLGRVTGRVPRGLF